MFRFFKKKKTIIFPEVIKQMEGKFITDNKFSRLSHFHDEDYRIIHEWETRPFYIGDKIYAHEFYMIGDVWYRNSFIHIVE